MKIKKYIISLIIIFSIHINLIKAQDGLEKKRDPPVLGVEYPGISCGKKNPKKESDCTKYGTDSEMLCCYIEVSDKKYCTLFYDEKAREIGISPENNFNDKSRWNCGNRSFYLSINIILLLILIFLYQ